MLTFEEIKELIELVGEKRVQGLKIEHEGFRLKVDGVAPPAPAPSAALVPAPASVSLPAPPPPAPAQAEPAASAPAAEDSSPEASLPEGTQVIHSPIVGTFYRQASPDADPYVEEGDRVKKGMVLCIVEAMKLMNEIESDLDGVIVKIYTKNAQPVEYGEPLFAILSD